MSAGTLHTSIYDLGAVAVVLALPLPRPITWTSVADLLAAAQALPTDIQGRFSASLDELAALIAPAIERPGRAPVIEDYAVLLVEQLAGPGATDALAAHPVVQAALLGSAGSSAPAPQG